MSTVTLDEVLELARQLSPVDKVRLIERMAPMIERDLVGAQPGRGPRRSSYGALAHLGPAPSAEEIDEARREMWANVPRDDV